MKAEANFTDPIILKHVRKYGDPFMVANMGLDVDFIGTGNFQNAALWTERGGFGAVSQFQRLDKSALDYLMHIQPIDACPFNSKMAFLCGERTGTPDRPYWTRGGDWKDLRANDLSVLFDFGTIVFGGQMIQVEATNGIPDEYSFLAQYQQAPSPQRITFYKIVGLRRVDWTRPIPDLMAEGLIQRGTWAGSNNSYHDTWDSGVVLHPVWSELDYPANNGPLYLAKDFCE